MKLTRLKCLLSIALFLPFSLFATDYYVAPTGSDANSGLIGFPKATINAAIGAATNGDVINVAAGTYSEILAIDKSLTFKGAAIGIAGTGTRPVSESILQAPVSGTNRLMNLTGAIVVIFDGFLIDGKNIVAVTQPSQSLTLKNNIAEFDFGDGDNNIYFSSTQFTCQNNLFKAIDGTNVGGGSSHIFMSGGTFICTANKFTSADAINDYSVSTTSLPVWLNVTTNTTAASILQNEFTQIDIGILLAANASGITIKNNDFDQAKRDIYSSGNGFGTGIAIFNTLTPATPVIITNNNFKNSETGIRTSSTGSGQTFPPASLLTINHNSFTTISVAAIRVTNDFSSSTNGLSALCNWYGSLSGPLIGTNNGGTGLALSDPSNKILYKNWLNYGTDASPALGLQLPGSISVAAAPNTSVALNNYRLLSNAVGCLVDNQTLTLSGMFNFSNSTANAAWALGNDGVGGNDDDYSVKVTPNINGATITASSLGAATVQGVGDDPMINLEGFLYFDGGDNKNWTISNLQIMDFDLGIGMFSGAGGTDAFEGLSVTNNRIKVPLDLNTVVAPADLNQNIGIHYSFGNNQNFANNIFEVEGDGASSGSNYSTSIVMQSNTSGGSVYDGLKIKDNTITVTGNPDPTAPAVIRGIWENGHNTNAAIEISGNIFTNSSMGNTANLNRQNAFWITSRSGAVKKVEYKNNEISGFKEGAAWLGGLFTGNTPPDYELGAFPVEIKNNKFDKVLNAIVVRKSTNTGNDPASPAYTEKNSFTNLASGGFAIKNEGTGNAQSVCNWYGSTSLAAIDALNNGPVYVSSYLNSGTDGSVATGFQPTGSCIVPPVHNVTQNIYYTTIQGAVTPANNGDSITVAPGIYAENIIVNKSVILAGPNSGNGGCTTRVAEAIVVPATNAVGSGEIFHVAASNVTIKGFLIDGDNPALLSGVTNTTGADMNAAEGITVYEDNVGSLSVSNNIFQNLSYFGVTLFGASLSAPATTGHSIINNKFLNLGTYNDPESNPALNINRWGGGVLLYNNQYASVTNNCMDNVRLGVQTGNYAQANPGSALYQSIDGNTITNLRRTGVFHNLHYGTASAYTVSNNNISGTSNVNETKWDGILLASLSVPSSTSGNIINGASVSQPSSGIEVWNVKNTTPAVISGGTVTAVTNGVFVNNYDGYNSDASPDGAHATISNITITPVATGNGIRVLDNVLSTHANVQATIGAGVVITNGTNGLLVENVSASVPALGNVTFTGQTGDYIKLVNNAGNIDATTATFGGTTGAGASLAQNFVIEDKISHKIDVSALGFVLVKANNTYVTPNSFIAPTTTAAAVQRGADAAGAGFTVNVAGGTYNGNINSTKNLNFEGAALGIAGTAARPVTESVLIAPTSGQLIALSGANTSVSFNGFKIDGQNVGAIVDATQNLTIKNTVAELDFAPSSNNLYSVGATLTLDRNLFKAVDGTNNGASSHIFSGSPSLTVTNNAFTSVDAIDQLTGGTTSLPVWLNVTTGTTSAQVTGNTFNKIDIGVLLAGDASNVNIANNDFIEAKRKAYTGGTSFGTGIALFDNLTGTNLNILNNNFANSETGIRTSSGSPVNTLPVFGVLKINYNSFTTISDTSVRVGLGYSGTLDARCNWWGTTNANAIDATTSNQVIFSPYLLNGTDADFAAPGFQTTALCNGTPVVIVSAVMSPQTCTGNGAIAVTFSGGTSPYSLSYTGTSSGGPVTVMSPYSITNLTAGTYTIAITDFNGSMVTASVVVTYNPVTNINTGISYTTIQGAIDSAATISGHVLQVCAGTYAETILVNKSLTINGPNASTAGCTTRVAEAILYPATVDFDYSTVNTTNRYSMMRIVADNVSVKGFTFNGDNPDSTYGNNTNGANIDIAEGITIETRQSGIDIQNNIFKNIAQIGVAPYQPDNSAPTSGNYISNNKFSNIDNSLSGGYGIGILMYNNFYAETDNNCMDTVGIGVQTGNYHLANTGSPAPTISNNSIKSRILGIWHNLTYATASNFTINTNTLNKSFDAIRNTGLFLSSINGNVNATVSGNIISNAKWGIELWNNPTDAPIAITGGSITNCDTAIFANNYDSYNSDGGTSNYVVDGVAISGGNFGIHVKDNILNSNAATTAVEIKNMTTISASTTGLRLTGAGAAASFGAGTPPATFTGQTKYIDLGTNGADVPATNIDATTVVFDGLTGATASLPQNFVIEDKINHKIDLGTLGFVLVKANTDFVTPNSFVSPNTSPKIQRGVDAAGLTGFTENVQNGTYADNVLVDKSITITGQSKAGVIVIPAISSPGGSGSLPAGASNVFLVDSTNVTIQNLTVDGDNPALTGITVGGADVDARSGIITNHEHMPFTVFNGLNVNNVTVKNVYNRGIYSSTDNTFNISNNTVMNVAGDPGSIAILNFGGAGIFANNNVSNANDGIASNNSTGTTYSGNTVTNSLQGIHTDNSGAGGGTPDIISNNTVTNGPAGSSGIFVYNPYIAPMVQANTITGVETGLANYAQVNAVTPTFTQNTVNAMGMANSVGILQTTDRFLGDGGTNVSGIYTNNFIMNNVTGFKVEYQAGKTNTITANSNSITGNTNGVQLITGGTLVNDFNCNWWGSNVAATVATAVGAPVNYIPYLSNGTDAAPGTAGFQPSVACAACTTLTATQTKTNNICNGGSTGTITATAANGVGPYTYTISPATGMQPSPGMFTGLPAGTYSITGFGANGCSTTFAPVTITQPTGTAPDASLSVADFTSNFFPGNGSEITILFQVTENAGNAALLDSIRITKQSGYNFSFPNVSTVTIGGFPYAVDNQRWSASNAFPDYRISINTGEQVNCGSSIYLAVKLTRATNSKANFTLTSLIRRVLNEVITNNNSTTFILVGQ